MKANVRPLIFTAALAVVAALIVGATTYLELPSTAVSATFSRQEVIPPAPPPPPRIVHQETPEAVKAVYMSQCAASSDEFRVNLLKLADETEINAIVVDLKDYSGAVVFPSKTALPGGKGCRTSDFEALIKRMHEHDIYVIGRMTVFQDPLYTSVYPELAVQRKSGGVWKDNKGLSFVDVGAKPFWEYIVTLSKEAHMLGVDEINFDYIRYPSDGPMSETLYAHSSGSHQENVERFFAYLHQNFKVEQGGHVPMMSADLFGMTATNYDDLNIGQVLERAMPYFDFIAPMVYPSHYPPNFHGYPNPNKEVYGVIYFSMSTAAERAIATTSYSNWLGAEKVPTTSPQLYTKKSYPKTMMRPWLQDFDYGGDYDVAEVKSQIQATYDSGLTSWMLWAPSNRYTRGALELEDVAAGTTVDTQ